MPREGGASSITGICGIIVFVVTGSPAFAGDDGKRMRILAIDTALEACAAAVFDSARMSVVAKESLPLARGHAEALMPLVARVMTQAGVDFAQLDRIAVTVGPGSFTGLRVGIAAARGIGLAAGKLVVGISTLEAYAAPLIAIDATRPVVAAIDARHGHVYLEVTGAGGRPVVAPHLAPIAEAVRASPAPSPRLAGNAAKLLAANWPPGEPLPALVDQNPAPDIVWVARLGALAVEGEAPAKPLYLRAPDAQPQNASQLARR